MISGLFFIPTALYVVLPGTRIKAKNFLLDRKSWAACDGEGSRQKFKAPQDCHSCILGVGIAMGDNGLSERP